MGSRRVLEQSAGFDTLGDTEIGDLHGAFVVHEDVSSLDVTVDDVLGVQIAQALQNLANEVGTERLRE
jgi:hypothetical protein